MGHIMDACFFDFAEADNSGELLEMQFVQCLICQAGLVIASKKPAALFGFRPRYKEINTEIQQAVVALIDIYENQTSIFGFHLTLLGWQRNRAMILVWRPQLIDSLLAERDVQQFLLENQLSQHCDALIDEFILLLKAFYASGNRFPHEIGVVLGYPVEDVRGFISDGGKGSITHGRWRVYGDIDVASRRFAELDAADKNIKKLFFEGKSMRELLNTHSF